MRTWTVAWSKFRCERAHRLTDCVLQQGTVAPQTGFADPSGGYSAAATGNTQHSPGMPYKSATVEHQLAYPQRQYQYSNQTPTTAYAQVCSASTTTFNIASIVPVMLTKFCHHFTNTKDSSRIILCFAQPLFKSMFLNIMFYAPMERFQLESELKLPLFSGFIIVPSCRSFVTFVISSALPTVNRRNFDNQQDLLTMLQK